MNIELPQSTVLTEEFIDDWFIGGRGPKAPHYGGTVPFSDGRILFLAC